MKTKNLSPQEMFIRTALAHTPSCQFSGRTPAAYRAWQKKTKPLVLATLGHFPEQVPPEPELVAEWVEDGLQKQRWLIEVQPHLSASFQINRPAGLSPREKRPAILCWHGHGAFGKEPVMGNASDLIRVFTNLVINAVEAMPDGGHLSIEANQEVLRRNVTPNALVPEIGDAKEEPVVQVIIRDTGEGIASEVLSRLFEPFATTKERGTGLGLAV